MEKLNFLQYIQFLHIWNGLFIHSLIHHGQQKKSQFIYLEMVTKAPAVEMVATAGQVVVN